MDNNLVSIVELKPVYDGRKSFYRKAHVLTFADGSKYLKSYDTLVCSIDPAGGVHRHWDGYSATTSRHVHEFCLQNNVPSIGGAAAWSAAAVESVPNDVKYAEIAPRESGPANGHDVYMTWHHGWLIIDDGQGHKTRYLYYNKQEALTKWRNEFGFVGKRLHVIEY